MDGRACNVLLSAAGHYGKCLREHYCSRRLPRLICEEMSPSQVRGQNLSQLKEVLTRGFEWVKDPFARGSSLLPPSVCCAHVREGFHLTLNAACSSRMVTSFLLL